MVNTAKKLQDQFADIDKRITALESIFISQGIVLLVRAIKRIVRESKDDNT